MSVSIKDIAKAAGVSHSTVSRALSDSPLVSVETKKRIQLLAHEMGYSPDARARSLVMGRTHTIGVVVTSIADPFIGAVVQVIERTAHDHGYTVILASSSSEPQREVDAVEMLQSKRVDGVIVTSSRVGALYHMHLERLGVPIVLLNSHSEQKGRYTYSIAIDDRHGGRLATQHLIDLGHRRIAYVTGPAEHSDDLERMAGYREALAGAGLAFDATLVAPGDGGAEGGAGAVAPLLECDIPPTAVFCYNDMTAIGLLRAAGHAGARIPQDLAVVGFDDIPFASYVRPPLTTVAQPITQMGQQAVQMVLDLKEVQGNGGTGVANSVFRGTLVVRASSVGAHAGSDGSIAAARSPAGSATDGVE